MIRERQCQINPNPTTVVPFMREAPLLDAPLPSLIKSSGAETSPASMVLQCRTNTSTSTRNLPDYPLKAVLHSPGYSLRPNEPGHFDVFSSSVLIASRGIYRTFKRSSAGWKPGACVYVSLKVPMIVPGVNEVNSKISDSKKRLRSA